MDSRLRWRRARRRARRRVVVGSLVLGGSGAVVAVAFASPIAHATGGGPAIEVTSDSGDLAPNPTDTGANVTLADAIAYANANAGTTISFASQLTGATGNTIDLGTQNNPNLSAGDLLPLTQTTTIDGPGITLNAAKSSYNVFSMSNPPQGATLGISGLTIEGLAFNDDHPASTYAAVYSSVPLTLTGVTISGTKATADGSSDIAVRASAALTMTGDTVTGNVSNAAPVQIIGTSTSSPASVSISGTTISNNTNSTSGAGGIDAYNATVSVTESTFDRNSTQGTAGAIGIDDGAAAVIANTAITDNTAAGDGGGISLGDGALTLSNSTLSGNASLGGSGGGIYVDGGTLGVTGSTLTNNTADGAGGIASYGSAHTTLINSTVYGNAATASGGGIGVQSASTGTASLTAIGDTVDANAAGQQAGGIDALFSTAETVTLDDTVLANNTAKTGQPDIGSAAGVTTAGFSLIGIGDASDTGAAISTNSSDQLGTSSSPLAPSLGALANNNNPNMTPAGPVQTQLPTPTSPLINAGDAGRYTSPATPFSTDELSNPRPVTYPDVPVSHGGDGADIGAVELTSPAGTTTTIPMSTSTPSTPTTTSTASTSTTTTPSSTTSASPPPTSTTTSPPLPTGTTALMTPTPNTTTTAAMPASTATKRNTIRTTVLFGNQKISLSRNSGRFANAFPVTFNTTKIRGARARPLTFREVTFTWRGQQKPRAILKKAPASVNISVKGLKPGTHVLDVKMTYVEEMRTRRARTFSRTVPIIVDVI